jgi:heat shock protein HtpX
MATQKAVFPRDAGLQARVLLTIFLLGLLYVALFVVIVQAGAGLATTVVILGLFSLAQLFFSDKLALASMGAKEVSPQQAPGLHSMIEKLCIQADLPKPKIAVADIDVPNAFAIGRSRKSATVCATTGIMRRLSPSELEGVMAHELAHVKHRDVLVMTIASFFASIAAIITQFGFFFGGAHGDDDNPSFAIVLLVSFVVYILSFFLMMALSRYRERGRAAALARPPRGGAARADERVLHRAGARQERGPGAVLDAPADGEADRAPPAARVAASGHDRLAAWVSSTRCSAARRGS